MQFPASDHNGDIPVHEWIARQADATPDAIAIADGTDGAERQLTYRQLARRSNQLARYLRKKGVRPGTLVGLCLERSPALFVGLLGILKSGGAYVPLDPAYPPDRLAFMIEDTGTPVILTEERAAHRLPGGTYQLLLVDAEKAAIEQESPARMAMPLSPEFPAYVIYTSGSTGRPKGAMISHRSLSSYAESIRRAYAIAAGDRVLQFHSISFDPSAEESYPCLMAGATLVLRTPDMLGSIQLFLAKCGEWAVSVLNLPTAYWQQIATAFGTGRLALPPAVRLIVFGGETTVPETLEQWHRRSSEDVRLINIYGTTETTIGATICDIGVGATAWKRGEIVPVGRPLSSVRMYVLDQQMAPTPPGVAGEIYIGGVQVGMGYLNRPRQTAERFVPDPFSVHPGARLYKTGDKGRFRPDAHLEFHGRLDNQVKLRGFRIELEEIEAAIRSHPGVAEGVVLLREDAGEKRLIAYAVPAPGGGVTADALRSYLSEALPSYMVPARFILLDRFPLTINDKIDRSALPTPELVTQHAGSPARHLSRTDTEAVLCQIWSDVLGVPELDGAAEFFELGGHSLAAIQIATRIRELLDVEIPLHLIFETTVLADLAATISQLAQSGKAETLEPILPVPRGAFAPLAFAQERVWFVNELERGTTAYNFQMTIRFRGDLDTSVLESALTEVVRRHEILRTSFREIEGSPVQQIHPPYSVSLPTIDLLDRPPEAREAELKRIILDTCQRPFDVSAIPLVRWVLVRVDAREHTLIQVEHHLIHDGWSLSRLLTELSVLYAAFLRGASSPLAEPSIQYADFALGQREWMKGEKARQQLGFWKQKLGHQPPLLAMPTDRPRPPVQTFRGDTYKVELPVALHQQLVDFSRREGVTLFMTMLAAFEALLFRYTGQEDITIATSVANRRSRELEQLIGMVLNNVVLRVDLAGNPTFAELLKRVRMTSAEGFANQDVPFEKVVEHVRPRRDLSYNPLFQILFSFHDSQLPDLELPGVTGVIDYPYNGSAKFDLNIIVTPPPGWQAAGVAVSRPLKMEWEYNSDLFDRQTVERLVGHYRTLMESAVADPGRRVSDLALLSAEELDRQLQAWNQTDTSYAVQGSVHEQFEVRAAAEPDAVALFGRNEQVTYRELSRRSNQLARHLQRLGAGPESRVALCMERTPEMVIGLLGVLKAGAAYVPVDPTYPHDRLAFVLRDANAAVVLTQAHLKARLPDDPARHVLCLDGAWSDIGLESPASLPAVVTPENLAYIIYTSGSTGRPKGVMIHHGGLSNYVNWCVAEYGVNAGSTVPLHSPLGFDLTLTSIFVPLLVGAGIRLLPDDRGLEGLIAVLATDRSALLKLTPSHLQVVNRQVDVAKLPGKVNTMIIGGEALLWQDIAVWQQHAPQTRIINEYGPTEAVVGCTVFEVPPNGGSTGPVPIGRPIANARVYVLDKHLQPVPVGVPGELHVAGAGVARGYCGGARQTAERFGPDPFGGQPGQRMYRTGDLARWRADGALDYIGRIDDQVKIRGYRIELGEIEAVLGDHPAVAECAVVARAEASGEKRLVAYVVPRTGAHHAATDLRQFLRAKVPEYMVPAAFVLLDALPLTGNGKVDREALPAPQRTSLNNELDDAPRTPEQLALAAIWAEILGCEGVGLRDNFFEIGGHSIAATQMLSRIRDRFGVALPLRIVFEMPTIAELANLLAGEPGTMGDGVSVPAKMVAERQPTGLDQLSPEEVSTWLRALLQEEETG